MSRAQLITALIVTLLSADQALGGVVISTSDFPLEPNKANQVVTFQIATDSGTCDLSQFDLRLTIGDGGSLFSGVDVPVGQLNPTVPIVTDIDIDLLFGAGATSSEDTTSGNGIIVLANGDAASGNTGVQTITTTPMDLFSVEFSTVGLPAGTTFSLSFVHDNGSLVDRTGINSECADAFSSISFPTDQTVAVPEPSSLLCLALLGVAAAGRRWLKIDARNITNFG